MSKKLIAGAGVVASFAVALAPLATFAVTNDAGWNSDKHTDTLNVTVLPTCAFGAATATPIDGITHNSGPSAANGPTVGTPDPAISKDANNATWVDGTDNNLGMTPDAAGQAENATTDTAYYRIFAGTADSSMATTTLKVVCNQNAGYKIYTEAADLTETGGEKIEIKAAAAPSATVTGYGITVANDGSAGATLAQVTDKTKTATVTRSAASAATGDTYTYTYNIGIAPTQKAATYTGNVVYTLVQQINSGE